MSKRVAITNLNASTIDILNTIRANASMEYQSLVPEVEEEIDIPKVGEVLYGYPAMANQFLSSLINRIALVKIKSATFNNAFAQFKKGYLEYGETVEEVFVGICKAREFNPEKAEAREFKRTIPDVRSAFHIMNWRVEYPITVSQEQLRTAFLSASGVQNLIAEILNAVVTSAEYDEFLLFKYLIIKAVAHGKMHPIAMGTEFNDNAVSFRSMSNLLTFMSNKYNEAGVHTTTPRADQRIIMDSVYDAQYDVNVLASAFNMDKATYIGSRMLIDDFTSFDNDRFDVIRANCDGIEQVTADELELMKDVKAVLVDEEWFQVYDNLTVMTEKQVASGLYWNYFYHTWKTLSHSPFSNAIVFVADTDKPVLGPTIAGEITNKQIGEGGTILTVTLDEDDPSLVGGQINFVQTADATENGVAVHKYGAYIFPPNASGMKAGVLVNGVYYESAVNLTSEFDVGDTLAFNNSEYVDSKLSALTIGTLTLDPTFDKDTTTYTTETENASNKITATAVDEDATIVITVNGTVVENESSPTWDEGDNEVIIKVSGTETTTYTVTVTNTAE